jgi:hypothetical protein
MRLHMGLWSFLDRAPNKWRGSVFFLSALLLFIWLIRDGILFFWFSLATACCLIGLSEMLLPNQYRIMRALRATGSIILIVLVLSVPIRWLWLAISELF